ncbi:MAG TPA: DUF4339 domain-containing protein [Planctomycetes bacterium]|nr:DUF4339 domain-containing protein [Planctomycetota bacterium]
MSGDCFGGQPIVAEWYLKIGDKEIGPLAPGQLKAMARRGQISPDDRVRRGDQSKWVPAAAVRGLLADSPTVVAAPSDAAASRSGGAEDASAAATAEGPSEQEGQPPAKPAQPPVPGPTPSAGAPPAGADGAGQLPVAQPLSPEAWADDCSLPPLEQIPYASPAAPTPPQSPPLPAAFEPPGFRNPPSTGEASHSFPPLAAPDKPPQLGEGLPPPVVTDRRPAAGDAGASPWTRRAAQRRRQQNAIFALAVVLFTFAAAAGGLVWLASTPAGPDQEPRRPTRPQPAAKRPGKPEVDIPEVDALLGESPWPEPSAAVAGEGPKTGQQWLDGATQSWTGRRVAVKVLAVDLGRVVLADAQGRKLASPRGRQYLRIRLELVNQAGDGSVEYSGWALEPAGVELVDDRARPCAMKSFPGVWPVGQQGRTTIPPGSAVEDVLLFEPPAEGARLLRLKLPARSFGEAGTVMFELPLTMVDRSAQMGPESVGLRDRGPEPKSAEAAGAAGEAGEPERGPIPIPGIHTGGATDKPAGAQNGLEPLAAQPRSDGAQKAGP